ncbi:MAG: hypothetical protein RL564_518 [Pseudomonadota bacterium]
MRRLQETKTQARALKLARLSSTPPCRRAKDEAVTGKIVKSGKWIKFTIFSRKCLNICIFFSILRALPNFRNLQGVCCGT